MSKTLLTQVGTHALALLIGLGLGYLIGHPELLTKIGASETIHPKTSVDSTTVQTDSLIANVDSLQRDSNGVVNPLPAKPLTAVNSDAKCGTNDFDIGRHLTGFAEGIEAKQIGYKTEDLSDCSGMFLRVVKSLEGVCDDYIFPNENQHRDTKALGKWFHDNGNLQLTENILDHAHLIKPGAVLFYGHRDKEYPNLTIEKLTSAEGIQHVGVVTEVKEEDGKVSQYSLFHGRTYGKNAGRTHYHYRQDKTNSKGYYYPPFGNGRQRVIAVGYITTPKSGTPAEEVATETDDD